MADGVEHKGDFLGQVLPSVKNIYYVTEKPDTNKEAWTRCWVSLGDGEVVEYCLPNTQFWDNVKRLGKSPKISIVAVGGKPFLPSGDCC